MIFQSLNSIRYLDSPPRRRRPAWGLLFLGLTALLVSLFHWSQDSIDPLFPSQREIARPLGPGLSVMTYNVQNLFDTRHDPGRKDWAFLPLARKTAKVLKECQTGLPPFRRKDCLELDWRPSVLQRKLRALALAIAQVGGNGPDLLILQEVENLRVLRQLNQAFPFPAYPTVILLEGTDPRGIDVAILSRFKPRTKPQLLPIPGLPGNRGLLEVALAIDDKETIQVMAFHFPSQLQAPPAREKALRFLAQRIQASEFPVIAAGDSNIGPDDASNPSLLRKLLRPLGGISHELGCRRCPGSYFHQGRWSFLDWIFVSRELLPRLDRQSVVTPLWAPGQVSPRGRPIGFKPDCRLRRCFGVSDHLPVYLRLSKKPKTRQSKPPLETFHSSGLPAK